MAKKESKKLKYISMKYYSKYLQEYKERRMDFTLTKTTYSRVINTEKERIIFNSEASGDYRLLALINRVRNDGKEYLEFLKLAEEKRKEILGTPNIDFFQMFEIPKKRQSIVKVDLQSAYWKAAIELGIVSEKTNKFFIECYKKETTKKAKSARLKALGSLATTKHIIPYEKGVPNWDYEDIKTEETKSLYMTVCKAVDDLMKDCQRNVKGVLYYYWDCIFVDERFSKEAIDFFIKKEYSVTAEKDIIEYVEISGNGYIVSTKTDKCYMVRKEDSSLAKWVKETGMNSEVSMSCEIDNTPYFG
jgi:hypothetical protein